MLDLAHIEDDESRLDVARKTPVQCRTTGWIVIQNHGIDTKQMAGIADERFGVSAEEQQQWPLHMEDLVGFDPSFAQAPGVNSV